MCDGLSRNIPKNFNTILSNCTCRARKKFFKINESFPKECRCSLKILEKVYANDAYTKKMGMGPKERLKYHQVNSATPMEDLKTWLKLSLSKKIFVKSFSAILAGVALPTVIGSCLTTFQPLQWRQRYPLANRFL